MSCGMFDQWELIHADTRQDAISDGVLVPYTFTHNHRKLDACFSAGLYEKYQNDPKSLSWIARRGIKLLQQYDLEDDVVCKRRVIVKGQIWVIEDGDGITFLTPQEC